MSNNRLDYYDRENGELFRTVEELENIGSIPKKIFLFLEDSENEFPDLLEKWIPSKYEGTRLKDIAETEDYKIRELIIENKDKRTKEYYCPNCAELIDLEEVMDHEINPRIILVFPKEESAHYFFMVTNEGTVDLDRDLNFLNAMYPFVSRVGFRSRELRDILENIEETSEVVVTDFVAKRYYGEERTDERHQNLDILEAFESAKESNTWIDSIATYVDDKRLRLSRSGKIQYGQDFDFSEIYHKIMVPVIEDNKELYEEVLTERSRTESDSEVKPIMFRTANAVFPSKENGEGLIEVINDIDHFEVAILNNDKAMPEIIVKDYYSGSSYYVNVIGNDRILVSPQTQVRELSLNSLLNSISDRYDGEVHG